MYKLKSYLNVLSLVNMYYAFVFPYLHYCNEVWGITYPSNLKRLVTLQKQAIRIITKSSYLAHTAPHFEQLKILSVQQINVFVVGRFMFKVFHKVTPQTFDSMFIRNRSIYRYVTRQHLGFHLPKVTSNLTKMSMRYRGAIVWNTIQRNVIHECSLESFKKNLKKFILQNQSLFKFNSSN